MSQVGNLSAGGSPVAAGGAGGNYRGLRQITGDFAHQPLAMAGLIVLALALLDAFVAPVFINPEVIIQQRLQGPSGSHLLGTDYLGRDELARLLYGVHTSMLLVGATLALAAVVAAIVFAVVRLLGRTRGQEWARWAGVVLTPVVGVLLLKGASLVVSLQLPSGTIESVDLFGYIFFNAPQTWLPIGMAFFPTAFFFPSLLVFVMLAGELVRFVYLLIQRLRSARTPQPHTEAAPVSPAWANVAVPAVAIGLWVAADALLLEGLLYGYLWLGMAPAVVPPASLGLVLLTGSGFINQEPWLVLAPLIAILVLYASLNVVGFALLGMLRRAPEPR